MCGIFGIVEKETKQDLKLAFESIKHRGPDDFGIYREGDLTLVHYRLAIQDLSAAGHQPMWSQDGRYCIVLNGEIYNHLDLRVELGQDIEFKSNSDAETMLYSFVKWGTESFKKLNGILFSGLFDKVLNELYLVGVPLGVKPCYYLNDSLGFAFCSELKALKQLTDWDRELDYKAFFNYLNFLWSPGSQTCFKNVKKLLPGYFIHYSVSTKQVISQEKYYEIPFDAKYLDHSEEAWIELLDHALQRAIKRQLLSDVPIAYFVSGGLDSSLILAIARKLQPDQSIKGFTIQSRLDSKQDGFADDLPYAVKLAEFLKIDLQIVDGDFDFIKEFPEMIYQLDEPQADVAPIYISKIAEQARKQNCFVLLSGTGGDDLFAGYRRHQSYYFDSKILRLPYFIRHGLYQLSMRLGSSSSAFRRLKKFLFKFQHKDVASMLAENYRWLDRNSLLDLMNPSIKRELNTYDPIEILLNSLQNIPLEKNGLNLMLYWDQKYFLADHNLNYSDKAGMLHGVEIRVPFLDLELIQLANQIPPSLKIKQGEPKYLLKKLAERYLPKEIIYRPKTGFGAPVRNWIKEKFSEFITQELNIPQSNFNSLFEMERVNNLINDNYNGKVDASYVIFELFTIKCWLKKFDD